LSLLPPIPVGKFVETKVGMVDSSGMVDATVGKSVLSEVGWGVRDGSGSFISDELATPRIDKGALDVVGMTKGDSFNAPPSGVAPSGMDGAQPCSGCFTIPTGTCGVRGNNDVGKAGSIEVGTANTAPVLEGALVETNRAPPGADVGDGGFNRLAGAASKSFSATRASVVVDRRSMVGAIGVPTGRGMSFKCRVGGLELDGSGTVGDFLCTPLCWVKLPLGNCGVLGAFTGSRVLLMSNEIRSKTCNSCGDLWFLSASKFGSHILCVAALRPAHTPATTAVMATATSTTRAANVISEGSAVEANTTALDPTVSAAILADRTAKYCHMRFLCAPVVTNSIKRLRIRMN
jgi:hypothetical protein